MKKIQTERDVIAVIDEVTAAVQSSSETKKFFADALRRLRDFRAVMENIETRIAIIGITSSGKSTLMNAVLGGNLLPTRVAPSSSKQVICGWDEKQEGEIVFSPETGKGPRKVSGNVDTIRCELEKYGDEKFNPGNREGVDEIRVHAPGFRFNRDLVIIDTPGLDAYGLDEHKEVTMKLVLPTVDMILFLTNVKCDSDATNLGFIDNVTTDSKPLVIVQNKIDSIEPKITKNGIEKTVEEVKHDHLVRIQRLVSNAKKESVRNAPIVQVSAKAPTWESSNLEELGRVLDEQIRLNADSRIGQRAKRLVSLIGEMSTALKPKLASAASAAEAQKQNERMIAGWQKNVDAAMEHLQAVENEVKRRLTRISDIRNGLLQEIDQEYERHDIISRGRRWFSQNVVDLGRSYRQTEYLSSSVEAKKRQFENEARGLNAYFSSAITETLRLVQTCCRDLKLDSTQVIRSAPFRSQPVAIQSCQEDKVERRKEKVRDRGLNGFLKRSFLLGLGSKMGWGWHTEIVTRTKSVYNIGKLVKEIETAYATFLSAFGPQTETFFSNTRFSLDKIVREMASRRTALREQTCQDLPLAVGRTLLAKLETTADEMRKIIAREAKVANAVVKKRTADTVSLSAESCPAVVLYAERFAHRASFDLAACLTDLLRRRAGRQKTAVCGWDENKLGLFREWFFREDDSVYVIDFSKRNTPLPPSDAVVFLLCNAEQTGSFKGKLFGSGKVTDRLREIVRRGKVVWVMDSVREHVAGGTGDVLMEAFAEMMKLVKEFMAGEPVYDVMACDREIYWSVLLHELYFNDRIYETETARQGFVDEMASLFGLSNERRHATGRYVAQFSKSRKEC